MQQYADTLSASTEEDIEALMLDLGQVLQYAERGTSSAGAAAIAMTQPQAAWICPIALRLVRFARSQGWQDLAALILPIASAGASFAVLPDCDCLKMCDFWEAADGC